MREDVAALRALTRAPVRRQHLRPAGPGRRTPRPSSASPERWRGEAERYGAPLGEPRHDDDAWADKLALVAELRVPVVSFTFGCPAARRSSAHLHAAGVAVWVTVTTAAEARAAAAAGADALVVQGVEAGGHRGVVRRRRARRASACWRCSSSSRAATDLPLVATGGIVTGRAVAAVLAPGASAAQLGTAFMLCPEAATAPAHREAIAGDGGTRR